MLKGAQKLYPSDLKPNDIFPIYFFNMYFDSTSQTTKWHMCLRFRSELPLCISCFLQTCYKLHLACLWFQFQITLNNQYLQTVCHLCTLYPPVTCFLVGPNMISYNYTTTLILRGLFFFQPPIVLLRKYEIRGSQICASRDCAAPPPQPLPLSAPMRQL